MVLPLWTKIMFMRHTTKTKILTEILNSEFGTSVIYYGIFQQWSPIRDEFESFERWMTERRWRFYVPWRWHLIFQTARFVRQDKKSIVFSLSWSQTTFSTDDLYYITAYSRIHVGTYGCSLLAFIPIDVDKLLSTMKNFERKPKKKPSNDNANAYKVFKPRAN